MAGMKAFTEEEIIRLLDGLLIEEGNRFYACLCAVLLGVGGRISEILTLRREDVIDAEGRIRATVRREKLKTRGKRVNYITVKLSQTLHRYIEPWVEEQRERWGKIHGEDLLFAWQWNTKAVGRKAVWKALDRAYRRMEIGKGHGTHGFRKSAATMIYRYWLGQEWYDSLKAARQVQRFLGHARIDTTIHYLGLDGDDPQQAVDHIFTFIKAEEKKDGDRI